MNTKKTIEIRQIQMSKLNENAGTDPRGKLQGLIPSQLSSKMAVNPALVLNLLGIFVLGDLVGVTYFWFEPNTGTGFIDRLTVTPDLHRLGYGCAALTKAIEQLSKIPGCRRIRTSFVPSSPIIKTLYHSLGFHETGERIGEAVVTIMDLPSEKKYR